MAAPPSAANLIRLYDSSVVINDFRAIIILVTGVELLDMLWSLATSLKLYINNGTDFSH